MSDRQLQELRPQTETTHAMPSPTSHISKSSIPGEMKYPFYVNNHNVMFKHSRSTLQLKFLTDWAEVEQSMHTSADTCAMYFPPSLELQYDKEVESRLVHDIQIWPFFSTLSPPLAQLAVDVSRFCSVQSELSYGRRILLHRHISWIFPMDEVTEKLTLYGLHATAGKMYPDNLKSITKGAPVKDMMVFKGSCPEELLRLAISAQRILAEDLMPLKKKLLSPHHLQACIDTLILYFDNQYEEGHRFCAEQPSQEILKTRGITIGLMVLTLLSLTSAQAKLYRVDDACLMQLSIFVAFFNDIIGLYKDLESVENKDDGSAYLNLVRVGMREHGYSEEESLRFYCHTLNHFVRCFDFCLPSYSALQREFYLECFKACFNSYDYHLMGILGNPNNRYGWRQVDCIEERNGIKKGPNGSCEPVV